MRRRADSVDQAARIEAWMNNRYSRSSEFTLPFRPVIQKTPAYIENLSSSRVSGAFTSNKDTVTGSLPSDVKTLTSQVAEKSFTSPHHRSPLGNMAEETIRLFHGLKDGREDALEFLEDLDLRISEKGYTTVDRAEVALRVTFRNTLRGDAYTWYQTQSKVTKATWTQLKAAFLKEYVLDAPTLPAAKPFEYFDLMYNLKQGDKDIVAYMEEAEQIHKECPSNLQEYLGRQFVAGLSDKSKFNMVHVLLDNDENFTFLEAKTAVIRAHRRIGQPSPFGGSTLAAKCTSPAPEVTQAQVNAKMLSLMEAMEVGTKAQDIQ